MDKHYDLIKIRMDIIKFFVEKLNSNRYSFFPQISDSVSWSLEEYIYSEYGFYKGLIINYKDKECDYENICIDYHLSNLDHMENYELLNTTLFDYIPENQIIWEIRMIWFNKKTINDIEHYINNINDLKGNCD